MSHFAVYDLPVDRMFFIRHAQSQGNVKGVFHANTVDWDLTDLGHAQAERAVPVLETQPIQAVVSSPMARVQQTLAPYLHGKDLDHCRDARLIERDFAGVAGRPIPAERNFFIEDPAGVEPTALFIARLMAGLKAGLRQEDMLLGGHAGVFHGLALGLGLDLDPWVGPYANATPTVLERTAGRWEVRYWDFEARAWIRPPPASRDWHSP